MLDRGSFAGKQSGADGRIVRKDWWNPAWIPFTGDQSDHLCLDLDPGPKGKVGQIIAMVARLGTRPLVAASFRDLLSEFADDLEAGKMVVLPDGDVFRRKEGAGRR